METRGGRIQAFREFLFGMFGYEHAQQALEIRASMDSLFMLMVFGDMIGVPVPTTAKSAIARPMRTVFARRTRL